MQLCQNAFYWGESIHFLRKSDFLSFTYFFFVSHKCNKPIQTILGNQKILLTELRTSGLATVHLPLCVTTVQMGGMRILQYLTDINSELSVELSLLTGSLIEAHKRHIQDMATQTEIVSASPLANPVFSGSCLLAMAIAHTLAAGRSLSLSIQEMYLDSGSGTTVRYYHWVRVFFNRNYFNFNNNFFRLGGLIHLYFQVLWLDSSRFVWFFRQGFSV